MYRHNTLTRKKVRLGSFATVGALISYSLGSVITQSGLAIAQPVLTTATPSKSERIDVRASVPVKQLLQEAARVAHKNVSATDSTPKTQAVGARHR